MGQPSLSFAGFDFDRTPFLVIWETTQACPLACQHCRAEAEERRDPNELTTDEGKKLLDHIHAMGTPVCVLSGGDPLRRPDLAELVQHGSQLGLRMATIPAASTELTRDKIATLKEAGLAQIAFSLDGSDEKKHDDFRKVPGTFAKTMEAIGWAHELDLPVQINTTFTHDNVGDADAMIERVRKLGIVFWEIFSLIPTGRGVELTQMSAEEHEALFAKLYALSKEESFVIKVTEAPHYRRFVMQQRASEGGAPSHGHPHSHSAVPAQLSREMSTNASFGSKAKGINAGKGFVFVSHVGEVYPSGFLPFCAGSIRDTPLMKLYQESSTFQKLRDPEQLGGRCGVCEYGDVCGGSRSRAYAVTGDMLAEDPACLYQPTGIAID